MKINSMGKSVENTARRFARLFLLALAICMGQAAEATRTAEGGRHNTVVILLDASGSMKGKFEADGTTRMTAAKRALKSVLAQVPPSTHVGLLVFSAKNLANDWAYPLGPRENERLFAAIDSIEPGTDTPLGKYIKIAADRLLEERARQFGYGSYRLLVVTDGEAGDQHLVERFTPEVIARGITMDVIGVGMKQAHTLAKKAHSYRAANDPGALNRALAEVFAEVRGAANDTGGGEAFAVIAGIPDGMASAMIAAVASAPNQPIGEIKAEKPAPVEAHAAPNTAAHSPAPAPAAQPADAAQATPAANPPEGKKRFSATAFILLAVVILFFRALRKGGRR